MSSAVDHSSGGCPIMMLREHRLRLVAAALATALSLGIAVGPASAQSIEESAPPTGVPAPASDED